MKSQTAKFKLDLQHFAEDQKQEDSPVEKSPTEDIDLEAIKKLRENSVPKEKYEKLEERYKKAVNDIINGNAENQAPAEQKPEFEEIVSKLNSVGSKPLNNLEFWKTALEFRKQVMDQGSPDPMVAVGRKVEAPTQADFDEAQSLADAMEECIKLADNDPIVFNQELKRRGLK